jgi:CubicO group peptidase (beta-lactamase class C family)
MAAGMSAPDASGWLPHAIGYIADWLGFQMRLSELPGSVFAVAHRGELAHERAYGVADIGTGEPLTPRHRFRVASHSKTFTSAGVMKLRDQRRLRLDDPVGAHVPDLHGGIAGVTVAQLLAHSGGVIRDGVDAGHWLERQPFLDAAGLDAELAQPLALAPNERFKYSNIGFGLLGKLIASVTGEPYNSWIAREVVTAAGLTETAPDMPTEGGPHARGHGLKLPLGRRAVFDGDAPTHALASATGFVSTAADLARFFGQLSPGASESVLSPESRREMSRRQWRTPHSEQERYYGLGTMSGDVARRAWFGHIGVFPGYVSRTVVAPEWDVAVSIVTNANDGLSIPWIDGALQIMNAFALNGAPAPAVADWTGRWWSHWGPVDLVPMGDKVVAAAPAALTPLADASEISVTDRLLGRIALANGYGNHGETVRRVADAGGDIRSVWLGGIELASEADLAAELTRRHPSAR